MTKFIVIKRMKEDRTYLPGEVVVDISRSDILMQRGYLSIVPDDYEAQVEAAGQESEARQSVQSLLDKGYSEGAAKNIASGKPEKDWPKYVKAEHEKITAKEELREKRTQAELDRLAIIMKTTADQILDLSDDDYNDLLDEHPSPAGNAASDAAEVESGGADKEPGPYESLMAMSEEGLVANMAERGISMPNDPNWFKDDNLRGSIVREILTAAGYSGEALNPPTTPATTEDKPEA